MKIKLITVTSTNESLPIFYAQCLKENICKLDSKYGQKNNTSNIRRGTVNSSSKCGNKHSNSHSISKHNPKHDITKESKLVPCSYAFKALNSETFIKTSNRFHVLHDCDKNVSILDDMQEDQIPDDTQ